MLDHLDLIEHTERIIDSMANANPNGMGEVQLDGFHTQCGLTPSQFDSALSWLINHECVAREMIHGVVYIRVLPL